MSNHANIAENGHISMIKPLLKPMGLEKTTFPIVARQADQFIGIRRTSSLDRAPSSALPPQSCIRLDTHDKDWVTSKRDAKTSVLLSAALFDGQEIFPPEVKKVSPLVLAKNVAMISNHADHKKLR